VECQTVIFREPVPDHDSIDQNQVWSTLTIPSHMKRQMAGAGTFAYFRILQSILTHGQLWR
jgi:hypothetical protein